MRCKPSAWPMSNSAWSRGDSMPFPAKKSVVFLMISRTVSISILVGCRVRRPPAPARQRGEFRVEVGLLQRRDDGANVTFHDLREVVEREPDPVISDAVLPEMIGADSFAAIACADLVAARGSVFRALFLLASLQEPRSQHGHRAPLVLELRALGGAGDDEAGRPVENLHGGIGGVDALAARPACAAHRDFQVLRVDLHVDLLGLR